MYIDVVPNRSSPPAILLRESFRQGSRVRKRTLANLSHWPLPQVETLRRVLRGETLVCPQDAFEILRSRPHGHVAATLGTARRLGLESLLGPTRSREGDLCLAMIVARILEPRSKLATARALQPETLHHTLAEELHLDSATEDELYAAMDWLLARQDRIERALARRHLEEGKLVFFDLTRTWFEGRTCPLARLARRGDGPPGKLQIAFGLLCNAEGRPVAVEVFRGNIGDPKTLASQIEKVRGRFALKRFVLVGDRGMITEARLREDLRGLEGVQWITALRSPAIEGLVSQGELQLSLFDERDLAEIHSPRYPGERLVACRNPLLAEERRRKREDLLAATERELDRIVAATRRANRPLRGKERITLRVGKVLGRYKMAKHFRPWITARKFRYERKEDKIAREAALDGIYVIRTSVEAEALSAEEAVRAYKRLSKVERAFRSLKTVDLKVRPIHHRLEHRVRSHVFLCMLAYYVEWHMRRALAPLLFDDHEPPAPTGSPVAPARRSQAAQAKAREKRLADGTPVQSFQDLLRDLATLAKDRVRVKGTGVEFDKLANATPLQQRAFDLLEVSPGL